VQGDDIPLGDQTFELNLAIFQPKRVEESSFEDDVSGNGLKESALMEHRIVSQQLRYPSQFPSSERLERLPGDTLVRLNVHDTSLRSPATGRSRT
jgi:hypothetical protein